MPYSEHPIFEVEDGNLLRYMNLPKFLSLITTSSLFFVRGDKLLEFDSFEGSYPNKEIEAYTESYIRFLEHEDIEKVKKEAKDNLSGKQMREMTFFSCWYFGDEESYSLWKAYSEPFYGITIQSSVNRIIKSLEDIEHTVYFGKVKYLDYKNDSFCDVFNFKTPFQNVYFPLLSKRKNFKDEQEYRIIFSLFDESITENIETNGGVYLNVKLDVLIEKIILAPGCLPWHEKTIRDLINKLELDIPIVNSVLDEKPI